MKCDECGTEIDFRIINDAGATYEMLSDRFDPTTPIHTAERCRDVLVAKLVAFRERDKQLLELAQELLGYVPDYFRNKWKFDDQLRALVVEAELL